MEDEEETLEVTRLERAPRPSGFTGDASTVREGFSSDSDLPPSEAGPPELPEGTRVDHYRVMRLLGRGGMGEVYLARDTQLGRKVALKIVLPDVLRSESEKQRFLFEARTTAALNHPHIVTIYGTGAYDDRPYVALEYLEGQNLRERLRERTPSLPETLRICLAIVEALAHAHENGILHRDLKPANVVIAQDGRLRVVDFGLAKVLADDDGDEDGPSFIPGLTQLQKLGEDTWTAGTPSYMAPEQFEGHADPRSDVYALG
ncbi:MAG: serine/threonine protein kinase, partial [Myxococcales bacterium]|nr:serine/threonine protein kinase [Myxococcales bacterium]